MMMEISPTGVGQRLYERAKKIIPGGTQLLSKRPEMYLPGRWPAYYSHAKGCKVWDLDGREYIDMISMGIGACVNGYANDEVDAAAKRAINNGVMCTLNSPDEVALAEKLLELTPWAGGVRYAKAGGEGMALAIRIARAYTEKDIILFCGYHGWHDWYLSANISDEDALNDQHLAGLEPLGVPKGLAGTVLPFHYNDRDEFDALIEHDRGKIAAIVMEPIRNDYPQNGFLEHIRQTADREQIVLVFDEITAGFRLCPGGSHLVLGVEPDLCVMGKAMTNGYPLTAIIGRKPVMEAAQGTFISSTFYTEAVGFAAALKNIEVYLRDRVWEKQIEYGKLVKAGWKELAQRYDLALTTGGIDPLAHFNIACVKPLVCKTYITQEMLKRGYLAATAVYTTAAHSEHIIEAYLEALDPVFSNIATFLRQGDDLERYLEGPCCHAGFERLN